jgi:hypothetical protein
VVPHGGAFCSCIPSAVGGRPVDAPAGALLLLAGALAVLLRRQK